MNRNIHIGIDFDNTTVIYDDVFYKHAFDAGLVSRDVKRKKQIIRDTIRKLPHGEEKWTELQAFVYGHYIEDAQPAQGVREFVQLCRQTSTGISIISHKTEYPALGPKLNLREAAVRWLEANGFFTELGLSRSDAVFVGTLGEKLKEIADRKCTHFVDDLIEVLTNDGFPEQVERILYGSGPQRDMPRQIRHFNDWNEITKYFFNS